MARSLSAALQAAMHAPENALCLLMLLTLEHAELNPPLRFVANPEDITSRGHVFLAFPFDVVLPDDEEDTPPLARLTADNVSREIMPWLRSLPAWITATVELVLAEVPDVVEAAWPALKISEASTPDAMTFTADLTLPDLSIQRYPAHHYVASLYPALARAA